MTKVCIKKITLNQNQQFPILFVERIPEYYFFKYIVLTNKNKSYRTKYIICRYYKLLYEYFESVLKLNLTSLLVDKNNFEIVVKALHGFTNWLHIKINSRQNYNVALSSIENFLNWYVYLHDDLEIYSKSKFKPLFKYLKYNVKSVSNYKSLSEEEIDTIIKLVNPNNEVNPFVSYNRLRNYLILSLLIETGLRLSELLLLKVQDFIRSHDHFYIKINNDQNTLTNDVRINKPSYKNLYSERIISISSNTYCLFDDYIKFSRHKTNLDYFVFKSNQGKPLSITSVQSIIKRVSQITKIEFSCHSLRHYFAESMLAFLIEECNLEMERSKDELRTICGWSLNSTMPNYYTQRYMSKLANKANIKRLENYNE